MFGGVTRTVIEESKWTGADMIYTNTLTKALRSGGRKKQYPKMVVIDLIEVRRDDTSFDSSHPHYKMSIVYED